jgi:hypothetical protein
MTFRSTQRTLTFAHDNVEHNECCSVQCVVELNWIHVQERLLQLDDGKAGYEML